MELGLKGRHVVVTGASAGIGLACARIFAAEGCKVVIAARSANRLAAVAAELGSGVTIFAGDLSKLSDRERLADLHGSADILVNNAGAIPSGNLFDIDLETWRAAWDLKVIGYIHLTQLFLRKMAERRSGTIVNVIGAAGRQPRWSYVCGGTGNAALIGFTGAVGGKSPDFGVRVVGINPGYTRTQRMETQARQRAGATLGDPERWQETLTNLPFGRPIEPAEIAAAVAFLASPACGYASGAVLDIDGGGAFRS
jgi:NAD(P)-dependent dehydrogenase (short-subunit alcohol dehydrogenase family)